jgi:hypothetical protein
MTKYCGICETISVPTKMLITGTFNWKERGVEIGLPNITQDHKVFYNKK